MTIRSRPFSLTTILPVSLLAFGLFMLSASPTTFAAGVLVFLMAGVVLTIMRSQATLPSAAVVPNPWPNSGFRTGSQRETRRS
jgi:hypothetical protein